MSYETYKLLHFISIAFLFLSIGALLVFSGDKQHKKQIMILHGLAGLVLFVSGFGLIARLKMSSFPLWVYLKLGIWIILSILIPVLVSRGVDKKWIWLLVFMSGFGGCLSGGFQTLSISH